MLQRSFEPEVDGDTLNEIARIVRRVTRSSSRFSQSEEDDLVQDIGLRLLERLSLFDPCKGTWGAFYQTIAMNYLRDEAKKLRRRHPASSIHETHQDCRGEDYVPEQTATESSVPSNELKVFTSAEDEVDLPTDIEVLLEQLSEELQHLCRAYLRLKSISAVAEHIGASRGTVHRRLKQLGDIFRQHGISRHR